MTKDKMKALNIIRQLPTPEMMEAHKVIEKGVDIALLYFWFNLRYTHYYPLFSNEAVQEQAEYFANRNPEFVNEIIDWFNDYLQRIKNYATDTKAKVQPSMRYAGQTIPGNAGSPIHSHPG
jgi:hypothetical protein